MASFLSNEYFTHIKEQAAASSASDEQVSVASADADSFKPVEHTEVRVTCDVLNVRESASTDKPRIGQLKRGATVTVTGVHGDWLSIDLQGNVCYIFGMYTDYLKPTATVTASSLNVRKGPGTDADKIGSLANGAVVRVLKEEKGWAEILHGKSLGYVSKEYLKFD